MDQYSSAYAAINQQAQLNNQWSAEQAALNRDWQERMSSTAHQREVEDLKAAGLNPILSTHGSGASTPAGAMGGVDTGNTQALTQLLLKAIDGMASSASSAASISNVAENVSRLNKDLGIGYGGPDILKFPQGKEVFEDQQASAERYALDKEGLETSLYLLLQDAGIKGKNAERVVAFCDHVGITDFAVRSVDKIRDWLSDRSKSARRWIRKVDSEYAHVGYIHGNGSSGRGGKF